MQGWFRKSFVFALLLAAVAAVPAAADEPFKVANIRVEGLVRISDGTLFNYLPIQPGETVDAKRLADALRAVYRAGFFRDVEFRRDGDDLVIIVDERPAIESFSVSGNKEIKTEDLERVLIQSGLAEGRIFDRSTLDQVTQELVRQYHARGRYGVEVKSDVSEVGNNQVRVAILVKEGDISGIRQINIIGNTVFPDEKLLEQFELTTPGMFTWISEDDRYAREKLGSDLEKLRSYYMDRGYADFRIESTQVSVSPDRRGVYITINLREGDVYTIKETKIVGDLPVAEAELKPFILVAPGSRFAMGMVNASGELMKNRLGSEGFAFADVTPYPELDREKKEVTLTLLVEAGSRVYVRHINFRSTGETDDHVYRREMRQMEGTWLTNTLVDRSRLRIARLPFVEDVNHKVERIPGSEDEVDVNFDIKERQAGSFNAALGFGGSTTGTFLDFSISHSNFLGTGNRVQIGLNSRAYAQSYNVSLTQPYWNVDAISRTISMYFNTAESFGNDLEPLSRENFGASMSFRWPLTEYSYFNFGVSASKTDLAVTSLFASPTLYAFVTNPNHGDTYEINTGAGGGSNGITNGVRYKTLSFQAGWALDTRNRAIFADHGMLRTVVAEVAVYPGDVQWYSLRGAQTNYFPLGGGFTIGIDSEVVMVQSYLNSADVPPDRKLFGGGADSVRGFRDAYLGPSYTASNGQQVPIGGNLRTSVQSELMLPNFFADDPAAPPSNGRFGLFLDVGMVYPEIADFTFGTLRASTGLAASFLTPIGAMRFSFAYPLRSEDTDETERFQFTIGTLF
jgi:outer membrane protein insertion porin family